VRVSVALLAIGVAAIGLAGIEGFGIGPGAAMAQMAPYDLMPPHRIDMVVRAAGLYPVAPPMRLGANYVVRAIDRYGTPMRIVVDGYYGEILAARRMVSLYPRESIAPQFDPYADPLDVTLGYRPSAPGVPRPGAAIPNVRRNSSDTPVTTTAPAHPVANAAPARTPMPRAKPSPESSVAAAVKPGPEQSPAHAPAADPPATDKAPEKPADQAFPPVQPLE